MENFYNLPPCFSPPVLTYIYLKWYLWWHSSFSSALNLIDSLHLMGLFLFLFVFPFFLLLPKLSGIFYGFLLINLIWVISILDHICFTLVWLISLIALYCFARVYVLRRRRKGRSRTLNFEELMFDVVPCWLLITIPCRALLYSLLVECIFSKKKLGKNKVNEYWKKYLIRIRWYSWGRPHECEYLNLCLYYSTVRSTPKFSRMF